MFSCVYDLTCVVDYSSSSSSSSSSSGNDGSSSSSSSSIGFDSSKLMYLGIRFIVKLMGIHTFNFEQ